MTSDTDSPAAKRLLPVKKIRTHYDNLKVSRDAPPEVIRMAYKALVTKHHPDRNPDSEHSLRIMQEINESYEILTDEAKRRRHDEWIADQERLALPSAKAPAPRWSDEEWDEAPVKASPRSRPPARPTSRRAGCLEFFRAIFLRALLLGGLIFAAVQTILHWPTPDFSSSSAPLVKPTPVPAAVLPHGDSQAAPSTVQIRWNSRNYTVRADRAGEIRKKADLAWSYVSDYVKLKEEKASLEKKLTGALFSRKQIQQNIEALDAQMKDLDASAKALMATIETEIQDAAP